MSEQTRSACGCNTEIGNLLPSNQRQRRTGYALCHILYPVSAAHTSIFRMDSNSTFYRLPHAQSLLDSRVAPIPPQLV